MGRGILKGLIKGLEESAAKLPEKREDSNALTYGISDALKSALAVFYFLHPSLLNFQQEMRRKQKRDNLETLFGVKNIPCTEQLKNIVDGIEPAGLSEIFDKALQLAEGQGVVEQYRVLDGGVLIPMDGVWYHSSEKIHCSHCLHKTKGEKTVYYHSMIGTALVKPGSTVVLPLMPEYIRNEDGQEKQDCERNAAKRYLSERGETLKWLAPTFLGDDLYSCHSICKQIEDMGMNFIFTCKDESHPWIAEQIANGEMKTHRRREWNGRSHLEYRYTWANGIENRCDGEKLLVNYLDLQIWKEEKGSNQRFAITYHNSWITGNFVSLQNHHRKQREAACRLCPCSLEDRK